MKSMEKWLQEQACIFFKHDKTKYHNFSEWESHIATEARAEGYKLGFMEGEQHGIGLQNENTGAIERAEGYRAGLKAAKTIVLDEALCDLNWTSHKTFGSHLVKKLNEAVAAIDKDPLQQCEDLGDAVKPDKPEGGGSIRG